MLIDILHLPPPPFFSSSSTNNNNNTNTNTNTKQIKTMSTVEIIHTTQAV